MDKKPDFLNFYINNAYLTVMADFMEDARNKFIQAGKIGKLALEKAMSEIEPGALFLTVAEKTEGLIRDMGAKPSFPVNLSINNEAAHYTPSPNDKKVFRTGDLVKVDIGASVDGYLSDNAATLEVGEMGKNSDLIDSTREALNKAISILRPGSRVRDLGSVIGETITSHGYKPVKNLGGHGVGRYDLHSSPFIPNYDDQNGNVIRPGQAIAIEPFASTGIGMIHNGPGGNIYILSGTKVDKNEPAYRNFNTIPFASRWLREVVPDPVSYLRSMIKTRQVSEFAILKEHSGAMIAQSEHTILILEDRIVVTTQ
jgi:methionyl aminopeptidase